MSLVPRISIVVPSFNQVRYISETLESLVAQQYPNLEVVIQDGGSTDGAAEIAADYQRRHPGIFRVFVEKDQGQADALNRGFARATGELLGFLNSDDTLYPGCLRRVAAEIDLARGRLIVFGRCLFTGEGSVYVGVEHPAAYPSYFEHLAIWKRGYNMLPQPSVFWHRRVWEKCGGFNPAEHHVLDYDLFCRFGVHFAFHAVDELWSTYRMHAVSKSAQRTEAEILEMSIAVSRRYWGPWWRPLRWRCEVSYWLHNRHLQDRARHHAGRAEEAARAGRYLTCAREVLATFANSPRMARDRLVRAWLARYKLYALESLLAPDDGFTGHHGDLWIGPVYRASLQVPATARRVAFVLRHLPQGHHRRVRCTLRVNGRTHARQEAEAEGVFTLEADIGQAGPGPWAIEIRTDGFFVPRDVHQTPDDRRLSVQLLETRIEQS